METLYLVCAAFGTTILIGQFILMLLGFGHHDGGWDHDVSTDHDFSGAAIDSHDGIAEGQGAAGDNAHAVHEHGTNWLFSVLTFRTVTAAVAFFGMAGMAATTAQLPSPEPLLIAAACGAAALYGVYYLMRGLYRLNCEGTQRIERAVGREGVVYLSIPGGRNGCGKIHLILQNRLLEFEAMTAEDPLPTGSHVVVTAISAPDRVMVVAAPETARTIHV